MASCKYVGSYTKNKDVIVLYNQNKMKIDDVSIIQEGMLLSFCLKINTEYIRILGSYAPSDGDEPELFFKCKHVHSPRRNMY